LFLTAGFKVIGTATRMVSIINTAEPRGINC
jgi:hypothetical protein